MVVVWIVLRVRWEVEEGGRWVRIKEEYLFYLGRG